MRKIIGLSIAVVLVIGLVAGGTWAYFSDVEQTTGNIFTAGTIDISLNPSGGQHVVTVDGEIELKPCQTGYTKICITNDGDNPCEVWKHIANVENKEHGTSDAEREYYVAHPGSDTWLMSNWIHYDLQAYKALGYSWYGEVQTPAAGPISVVVEDGDCAVTWTIDFPLDDNEGNGSLVAALVIALDGEGQYPAFQIHNHDWEGDGPIDAGTWCYSPNYGIGQGWFGWRTGEGNDEYQTLVDDLPWVTCTGDRYNHNNPDNVLTISIDKCRLVEDFHWKLYLAIGSGFYGGHYQQSFIPAGASWGDPIVNMATPNYVYAEIAEQTQEIPEAADFMLTGTRNSGGVECFYVYLGVLEPGESMCVIQSYHLDASVDNWAQTDRVFFDMEFVAQQTEGEPPAPPPGTELPGYAR